MLAAGWGSGDPGVVVPGRATAGEQGFTPASCWSSSLQGQPSSTRDRLLEVKHMFPI